MTIVDGYTKSPATDADWFRDHGYLVEHDAMELLSTGVYRDADGVQWVADGATASRPVERAHNLGHRSIDFRALARPDGSVVLLRRAERGESHSERVAAAERNQRIHERRRQAREAELDTSRKVPLDACMLSGLRAQPMTLRAAAATILDLHGELDVNGDGLVVRVPFCELERGNGVKLRAAAVALYAGERHVVAWDRDKRKGKLPDRLVTPNGALC